MDDVPGAPHHVVFDCSTGETTYTLLTEQELADADARRLEQEQARAAADADDQALRDAVAAHSDPTVKALAARLGLA